MTAADEQALADALRRTQAGHHTDVAEDARRRAKAIDSGNALTTEVYRAAVRRHATDVVAHYRAELASRIAMAAQEERAETEETRSRWVTDRDLSTMAAAVALELATRPTSTYTVDPDRSRVNGGPPTALSLASWLLAVAPEFRGLVELLTEPIDVTTYADPDAPPELVPRSAGTRQALQRLAAGLADRPGYRQEWAP